MLPSGNDAAQVLAENFGFILKCEKQQKLYVIDQIKQENIIMNYKKKKQKKKEEGQLMEPDIQDQSHHFIQEMNNVAR